MEINAQFQKFVDFARAAQQAGNGKSIARAGEGSALDGRTITAATTDKVAAFIRSRANKNANNVARDLFRQAVVDMFGGESKIPENVRKAMILGDYGAGKPLTARRILAVQTEVAKASLLFDRTLAAAKTAAQDVYDNMVHEGDDEVKAYLDGLIETAVKTALKDKDALEILKDEKAIRGILVGGDGQMRTNDAVARRVTDLMANLAEIRKASGGDRKTVQAGVSFLKLMGGKSIRPGVLANIIRAVKNANIGDIKKLASSSQGAAIHRAVAQFTRLQVELSVASGAEAALDGADEKSAARNFVAELLIAKCGASNVAKMQQALSGDNARKMVSVYDLLKNGSFDKTGCSKGILDHISTLSARANNMLIQLKMAVDTYMGVPEDAFEAPEPFEGPFDKLDFGAGKVLADLTASAKVQSKKVYDNAMSGYVGGKGPAADAFRKVVSKRITLEPGTDPKKDVACDANCNIISLFNWNICRDAKIFALGNGRGSPFAKDLPRQMKVNLPNGRRLSSDYDTALDELAAFATKGVKTSYAALDPKEKNKVHIVISFLSQECGKAVFDGQATAFDPTNAQPPFVTASEQSTDVREFTIGFNEKGDLQFDFLGRMNLQAVVTKNDAGKSETHIVNEGSTLEAEVSFKMPAREFERLSGLDFTKFDDSATETHMDNLSQTGRLEKIPKTFGEEFRIQTDMLTCNSRIHAEFA